MVTGGDATPVVPVEILRYSEYALPHKKGRLWSERICPRCGWALFSGSSGRQYKGDPMERPPQPTSWEEVLVPIVLRIGGRALVKKVALHKSCDPRGTVRLAVDGVMWCWHCGHAWFGRPSRWQRANGPARCPNSRCKSRRWRLPRLTPAERKAKAVEGGHLGAERSKKARGLA